MGAKCAKGSNQEYGDLPRKGDGDEEEVGELEIKEVDNGGSINDLIKEVNKVVAEWADNYQPISDSKDATLKASGMEKKKTAGAKECMLGLSVAVVADAKMTPKEFEDSISFIEEAPFVQFQIAEKWDSITSNLKEWVEAYI